LPEIAKAWLAFNTRKNKKNLKIIDFNFNIF